MIRVSPSSRKHIPIVNHCLVVFFWVGTATAVYVLLYWLAPETKGRTFAELDELFDRKIAARKSAKPQTSVQETTSEDSSTV